jgi:TonB-dependent SusC/RagA subfamily outer membrane receptor
MTRPHPASIAATAIAIVPLLALLACAAGGSTAAGSAPGRAADGASVGNVDGKSMEDLFAGRFPGVSVTRADGGGLRIRIRGGSNSFYGGSEPLYVVDGTPLPPGTGGVVFLNPRDIERIEVLKNPADIALYGVRGGNGVIRITTVRPGRR